MSNDHEKIEQIKKLFQTIFFTQKHSIESARKAFDELYLKFYHPNFNITQTKYHFHNIPVILFTPDNSNSKRILIFLHGGGFTLGSTHGHIDFIEKLTLACNIPVLSIDYRLSPEYPFPTAINDCSIIYQSLLTTTDPGEIILVGMTAGASIVLSLLLTLKYKNIPFPKAAICLSPPTDFTFTNNSIVTNHGKDWVLKDRLLAIQTAYLKETSPTDPIASPYYANLSCLPPLLLQVGGNELLLDDSVKFYQKAKVQGVDIELQIWDGMIHGWHMFSSILTSGKLAIKKIANFISSIYRFSDSKGHCR